MTGMTSSEYSEEFAKNLRVIMARDSVSGEDLARRLRTSGRRVAEWRRGRGEPKAEELARLADALNVSLDVLMGRHGIANAE